MIIYLNFTFQIFHNFFKLPPKELWGFFYFFFNVLFVFCGAGDLGPGPHEH